MKKDRTAEEAIERYMRAIESGQDTNLTKPERQSGIYRFYKGIYLLGDGDWQKGYERLAESDAKRHEQNMKDNPLFAFAVSLSQSKVSVHKAFIERIRKQGGLNIPIGDELSKELLQEENNKSARQLPAPVSEAQVGAGLRKDHKDPKYTILFLASDPSDQSRIRLGQEFREIDEQLKKAKYRENFNLALPQLALRPKDISGALLNEQPQIVHFSGHGTPEGALCFENEIGKSLFVQPDALAALFKQFADKVICVLLNSCHSEIQAKAIAKHVAYVIGMNQAIDDEAAIAFSIGFYQALGAGRSIEDAYDFGCVQIGFSGTGEHLTPILYKKGDEL